ncbi:unnamed protein product, partial [Larinioides sclopetarius]
TEGLLAIGGICLGAPFSLKGQPVWVKAACTTGALCIFLVNSDLQTPVNTPSSWVCMLSRGIVSGAGIEWCLTVAFKEQPKSTIAAFLAGVISICLTNSIVFHEMVPTPGDGKQPEESIATREVTTQNGFHCQQVNCNEREKSIGKKSPDTGAEVEESNRKYRENTICNVKFPANDKSIVRSKQQDIVTSGRPTGSVSESFESHLQAKSTVSTDLNFRRISDKTGFKNKEKIMSVKENSQRVPVASRFQDMCSTVRTSHFSSSLTEGTVAVVPVDNSSGGDGDDEATDVDEVARVKSLSKVIDHSQKSENLSTSSGSPDEAPKITQYVRLLESDESLSV